MKPITAIVKEKGGAKTYPSNQEVTLNPDGSGGPILKIGLQGLGAKGNNGYKIGSEDAPTKKKFESHKMYKNGKVEIAETKKEHLSLGDEGYDHTPLKKGKDACYSKVKGRYKKWPSAYASGALVKCRKVGAANWGNKSK